MPGVQKMIQMMVIPENGYSVMSKFAFARFQLKPLFLLNIY